jgi:hypothetical protein
MHTVTAVLLLTARFYSVADVPPSDRVIATQVAANILRAAGIDVRWTDCKDRFSSNQHATSPVCLTPPNPDEVIVRFVSSPQPASRVTVSADSLGDAYVDTAAAAGSLATVYVDRVENMARAAGVDAGTLLGRVMAHEIGHLLLGTPTHRPSGLMRAQWSTTLLQRRMANDWRLSSLDAASARDGILRRARTVEAMNGGGAGVVTVPCVQSARAPSPASCPLCPVCATLSPADRMSLDLLVEPRF